MKICILGGAGYIGTACVEALQKEESITEIVVIDNLRLSNNAFFVNQNIRSGKPNIRFVYGDILDSNLLRKELKDVQLVLHLASLYPTKEINYTSHSFEQINHWGTSEVANVVEFLNIPRLIYLSDCVVYEGNVGLVDDTIKPICHTPYAYSVLRAESQLSRLKNTCQVQIVRIPQVYGFSNALFLNTGINFSLWQANFIKRIQIEGNGRQIVSAVYLTNLVHHILKIVLDKTGNSSLNIVSDFSVPFLDILEVIQNRIEQLEFVFINSHYEPMSLQISPSKSYIPTYPDWKNNIYNVFDLFSFV